MTNLFASLVDIDNSASFDKVYWLVEERGLSLTLLDAEVGVEQMEGFIGDIKEQLAEMAEKGKKAKAALKRRIELEKKAKYWGNTPDWFTDSWFEDNSYVQMGDVIYQREQYRKLDNFVKEYEVRVAKLDMEDGKVKDSNTSNEDTGDIFEPNWIHWRGAKEAGMKILSKIKFLRKSGRLHNDRMLAKMVKRSSDLVLNKEICQTEYLEIKALLYRWRGMMPEARTCSQQLEAKLANKTVSTFKSDPEVYNAYNVSIEDAIDIKWQAEKLCNSYDINFEDAVAMILEGETSEETPFFACYSEEDTTEEAMAMLSITVS